jgi:hypothetical protein
MNTFLDYYRCPDEFSCFEVSANLMEKPGYFQFGGSKLYGRTTPSEDITGEVETRDSNCYLPFDPDEVVTSLREEKYMAGHSRPENVASRSMVRCAYYAVRPWLGVGVRKHLQRWSLRGAEKKPFPSWPVDRTVDQTLEKLMRLALTTLGVDRIPFIWFWPDGHSACASMTHDVETSKGLAFCSQLMDLNDSYGIKSSFQIVPADRYSTPAALLDEMRERDFEINVHDWNHDGNLYSDRKVFLQRAEKINRALTDYRAQGFRSAVLYRNPNWYDAYNFSYDMSFPNVGHMDPQPGGCCTVMPYFIGRILEIPVTTTQDYALFHIRNCYSMELWKRQLDLILEGYGLASFIVHPDYIIEKRARAVYSQLLEHLSNLRADRSIWIALPRQINQWWRERSQLRLVKSNGQWSIEGPGKERASLAYATWDGQGVAYTRQ